MANVLADPRSAIPELIRASMKLPTEEIRFLEQRIAQLGQELTALVKQNSKTGSGLYFIPHLSLAGSDCEFEVGSK